MLSICIPVYNYDVTALVNCIHEQLIIAKINFEIIVIDDCSESRFRQSNSVVASLATYVQLEKNIGRAKIRNLFLDHVKYDYLLFLDCDSKLISNDFVANYISAIELNSPKIICGGRIYAQSCTNRSKRLRWRYGKAFESKTVDERRKNPNHSFMTNNYVIHKSVFKEVQFDERLTLYGHEDTVYGLELKLHDVDVTHIDNPVMDNNIELNDVYLLKTEESIINLTQIIKNYDHNFVKDIRLVNTYFKLKSWRLLFLIRFSFFLFGKPIKYFLRHGYVNLSLYGLYKLGLFISLKNKG